MSNKIHTLDLSSKDLLTLLKMVLVADSVICGIHDKPEEERPEYYHFSQKFLQLVYDAGFTDVVEYDLDMNMYFPTKQFDDDGEPSAFIQEYDEQNFWDDLIHNYFGMLFEKIHGKARGKMMLEMILQDHQLFEAVENEVMKNGLKNFVNSKINQKKSK